MHLFSVEVELLSDDQKGHFLRRVIFTAKMLIMIEKEEKQANNFSKESKCI